MRVRKNVFEEYCPICWVGMERRGTLDGKVLYICPVCGMATDGRRDNGRHVKQLVGAINKL